jgi:hypothetical protein
MPGGCLRFAVGFLLAMVGPKVASAQLDPPVDPPAVAGRYDAVALAGPGAAAWANVAPRADFLQREPHEGAPPSQRTEFRVTYGAATLYVKVRAFDTQPDKIVGYLTRRDADSPSDWIRVFIDSYHDRRTAYEFAVNPAGVKVDRYWFNDTNRDDSWDAVWDVTAARDPQGWTAEFSIPFSQLRFAPGTTTVGFAVVREIGRLNEISTWPLLARSANGFVSSFGELDGLSMAAAPKRLELVPYSVANLTRQSPAGNPLLKRSAPGAAFGLDLKYALTSGLTLTSTLNPDFGQVEADPAVVNLTAFETFFAERRPFFVEGSGNFQFDLECNDGPCNTLFYSRRIGRPPQGVDSLPSGNNVYADAPGQTTILGATKLTGRVGKFSIGAMQAVTKEASATVLDGALQYARPVEPLTSYSAGRVRREFDNQPSVGLMMTAVKRRRTAELPSLTSSAVAGGLDFDWRFKSRYALSGYWAASDLRGAPAAIGAVEQNSRHYFQRPDTTALTYDPARTSLSGVAGRLSLAKIGGQHVIFTSAAAFKSPGFDVDDLGFFKRADERSTTNWLQIKSEVPTRWFRSRRINFNQWASWNSDGNRLQSGQNVNAHAVWTNNWGMGAGVTINQRTFDDRLTRGGPGGLSDGFSAIWSYVTGDERRPIFLSTFSIVGHDGLRSAFRTIEPTLTYRPTTGLTISAGPSLSHNVNDYQWVATVTDSRDHYVFAHLNQTTVGMTGRVNYTITPALSVQLYAQPFASGQGYTGFKELVDGRNPVYDERYAPFGYAGAPDFSYRSFRTTNVLRWEYKPGSTLFVVWQQGRDSSTSYGDFRFGRDFGGVLGVPPRNVLLVKLAYWFNY